MKKHYKLCVWCSKWVVWDYIDLDRDWRIRICPKCLHEKKVRIAWVSYRKIDGVMYQSSWDAPTWQKSSEVNVYFQEGQKTLY